MRLLCIIIFLAVFLSASCVGAAAEKGSLQLTVTFDKEEYKANDPVSVSFALKNTGKEPVYVNKRFQIASKDSPKEDREIYFIAMSPKGEEMPYKAQPYKPGLPKSDYFVLLKPGEEAASEHKMNFKAFFEVNAPGEYKITAVYQNAYGKEIGVDAVKEEIKSKPVMIKISE